MTTDPLAALLMAEPEIREVVEVGAAGLADILAGFAQPAPDPLRVRAEARERRLWEAAWTVVDQWDKENRMTMVSLSALRAALEAKP